MFKRHIRNEKGFTMIEMMVVLIIIAVLIAGGIKFYLGYIENAKVTKAKAQISNMQALMDSWYAEKGSYPLSGGTANTNLKADGCELIVAGIKATVTIGDAEYVRDPWGGINYYTFTSGGTGYEIRTGYTKVQGTDHPVVGIGADGVSIPPSVIAAVY